MSLLLPTASSTQAKANAANGGNLCPPPGTPGFLTCAPSSCPSAYDNSVSSQGSTPALLRSPHGSSNGSDRTNSPTPSMLLSAVFESPAPAAAPSPHMTPMGTPITASLSMAELRYHRQFLHHQRTQVVAFEHELLHKFILKHTNQIQSVSRSDHKIMVKTLISEAYRADPNRKANRARWERVMREAMREVDSKNSVLMSIAPDPYHGALAKLSSMLLWNPGVQYWSYRYWEEEMLRRRSVQQATLAQLRGKLFLDVPVAPTANKFA